MDRRLCRSDLCHVGGHDGGDDAAERRPDGAAGRRPRPAPRRRGQGGAALFASGYLAVWFGFGLVATGLQWALDRAGLLSPRMAIANAVLAGAVFLAAGIYQWTPLKDACLRHCRSPVGFLVAHWREGRLGMASTGMRHGAYCLGCCWMLMALLFAGGLMNLAWVAAIALFVLAEKAAPWGGRMSRAVGVVLALCGVALISQAALR